jgi:thioredoxin 1
MGGPPRLQLSNREQMLPAVGASLVLAQCSSPRPAPGSRAACLRRWQRADQSRRRELRPPQRSVRLVVHRAQGGAHTGRLQLAAPNGEAPVRALKGRLFRRARATKQRTLGCLWCSHRDRIPVVSDRALVSAAGTRSQSTMSSDLIKHVTDDSFSSDVLQSDKPVLVDYWAEWCGPCKMIAPILEEVSKAYEGRVQVAKLNVDENRGVPGQHGIRGIPTLMLFKDGKVAATKVGALSKAQLTAFLDGHL